MGRWLPLYKVRKLFYLFLLSISVIYNFLLKLFHQHIMICAMTLYTSFHSTLLFYFKQITSLEKKKLKRINIWYKICGMCLKTTSFTYSHYIQLLILRELLLFSKHYLFLMSMTIKIKKKDPSTKVKAFVASWFYWRRF